MAFILRKKSCGIGLKRIFSFNTSNINVHKIDLPLIWLTCIKKSCELGILIAAKTIVTVYVYEVQF